MRCYHCGATGLVTLFPVLQYIGKVPVTAFVCKECVKELVE